MQITKINNYNNNIYRTSNNRSVNFKSAEEKNIPAKVMNMLKNSVVEIYKFEDLNSVNKYIVPRVYNRFRELQKAEKVDKFYVAMVYWNIQEWISKHWNIIDYPIMHHRFSDDRMIIIHSHDDENKWKWNIHEVKTEICEIEYDEKKNYSTIMVKIHKWIRHQIRIHLSSIWFPICGDDLYCKSKKQLFDKLQLFSVWMRIDESFI